MSEDRNKKIRVERAEEEKPVHQTVNEIEDYERRKAVRIVLITFAIVFTLLTAMSVGAGLALWDMEKKPKDLIAAIKGDGIKAKTESGGLTFIDADSDGEESALTFIDPEEDADTALTFIDPEDETSDELEGESVASDDGEVTKEAGDGEDSSQVGDILDDGSVVVSSELAFVKSIMRAGSDQAMTVTALSQTNITDPNASYPLPFTSVDESYFNDALFIGDSRLQGFGMWSGLPGTYYCATGFQLYDYKTKNVVQTGNGKVPIFAAIPYNAFTKIYIKVGLNEMGWGTEAGFEEVYAQLIADLRAVEPRAIIYIHAVLPVTAAKSASDRSHNNPNVIARNSALKQFAAEQKAYFIDAGPAVSDESGCLKPEMTSDGIHLSSRYMGVWKQYLLEHAVVVPDDAAVQVTDGAVEDANGNNAEASGNPADGQQTDGQGQSSQDDFQ